MFIPSSALADRTLLVKDDKALNNKDAESTNIAHESLVDRYGHRADIPPFANLSLASFAPWFDRTRPARSPEDEVDDDALKDPEESGTHDTTSAANKKLLKRAGYVRRNRPKIIRFVNYKEGKDPQSFYREQVLPWRYFADPQPPGDVTVDTVCRESAALLGLAADFQSRYAELNEAIEQERSFYYKDPDVCYEDLVANLAEDELTDTAWGEALTNLAPSVQHMNEREGQGAIEATEDPNEIPDVYDLA
jgi:hypothetical protein